MRSLLIAMLLAGCADEPAPVPEGPHYRYVMSELKIPVNNNDARAYGLDLNNDGVLDNQLGMVFGTLSSLGLGVDGTAREAMLRGGINLLVDLQTVDFGSADVSGVTTYLGSNPSPAPCLDPADLSTCGQQLKGTAHFSIEPDSFSDVGVASVEDSVLLADVNRLPVKLALDVTAPLRVDLHGARVKLTGLSETGFRAVIAGAIKIADVDRVMIPQAATEMNRIVTTECGQPSGVAPCGCLGRSRLLQKQFDKNLDCAISVDEVRKDDLVTALLAPDVTIDGEKQLSFGVGIELVRATF